MAITDKKGINVTSGFKLVSGTPIDARFVADDETDLNSLITNGAVYEGLEVYVKSLGKKLQYNGTEFVEVATGGGSNVNATVEGDTLTLEIGGSSGGSNTGTSGGGISKVFEDVEELPESPDSGLIYRLENNPIPVPNDGSYVEQVYLNVMLSKEDVIKIIDNANLPYVDGSIFGSPDFLLYPIIFFDGTLIMNDPQTAILVVVGKLGTSYEGVYNISISGLTTGGTADVFSTTKPWGWSVYTTDHIFPVMANSISSFNAMPIGTHNDRLTSIISMNKKFTFAPIYYNYDGNSFNVIQTNDEQTITIKKKTFNSRPDLYGWLEMNEHKFFKIGKGSQTTQYRIIRKRHTGDGWVFLDGISTIDEEFNVATDKYSCNSLVLSDEKIVETLRTSTSSSIYTKKDSDWVANGGTYYITVYYLDE